MKPGSVSGKVSNIVTRMTKADALAPIVALEGTVVSGRVYQAYKRGKWDEARERGIEETTGSIVWLCGVRAMNDLGDKILAKILKKPDAKFDVGTDKILRTPFENFMRKNAPKGFTGEQVAMLKGAKVLTSIVITNLFIGFVVPKFNQALTRKIRHDRRLQKEKSDSSKPVFKGGALNAINKFTNAIENTNTGKLLSSDAGIAGGRMYNARRKEERREVFIRDVGSIYFYMWAQGHVRNLLNLAETGKSTRLNPSTAKILSSHLSDYLGNSEISAEEFRSKILGKNPELPEGFVFESAERSAWEKLTNKKPLEVIKLSEAQKIIRDKEVSQRAEAMSRLQPERMGEAVLTKQQLLDAYNKAEINNPELLDKVFTEFTGGVHKEKYKYISNKKLYNLKSEMESYVETICKAAGDGKVDKKLVEKIQHKNLTYNGINFAVGFGVAAAFLSTIIPKIQYYVTKKTTGVDVFPGVYDFEHHQEDIC